MKSLKKQFGILLCVLAFVTPSQGQETPTEDPQKQTMIEHHQKMAQAHQDAAACLKGGKSQKECHDEMMKNCPMKDEAGNCPMMGMHGKMGKGMHGKGKAKAKGGSGSTQQ